MRCLNLKILPLIRQRIIYGRFYTTGIKNNVTLAQREMAQSFSAETARTPISRFFRNDLKSGRHAKALTCIRTFSSRSPSDKDPPKYVLCITFYS